MECGGAVITISDLFALNASAKSERMCVLNARVSTDILCILWFFQRDNHWPTILKFKIAINHGNFIYEHICKIVFVCFE